MKTITLPWPPKELSPNATLHWAKKAKYKKSYRTLAWGLTLEQKIEVPKDQTVPMVITFYPPDKRHRDYDNRVASIKAGLDGVADALRVNDRLFRPQFNFSEEILGKVTIEIQ